MNEKEITLDATVENIAAATDFVDEMLETVSCPIKSQMQIDVALDELFSNVARYAYTPEAGKVTLRVLTGEGFAEISLADSGKPYDPLAKEDPDITLSAQERPIGGLGIFLVKKTMDEVQYRFENGKNITTIKKVW